MNNDEFKLDQFASSGKANTEPLPEAEENEIDFNSFLNKSSDKEYDLNTFAAKTEADEEPAGSMEFFDVVSEPQAPQDENQAEDEFSFDTETENKGQLDDSNLTDDFVIGKDFFIDSTEADVVASEVRKKSKKKRKKKSDSAGKSCLLAVIWMALIFVISISAAASILYFGMDYLGVGFDTDATAEIQIVVEDGEGAKAIAQKLKDAGIIDSPLFFRFYAHQSGHDVKFQHGIYYFTKQDSYEDIAEALSKQGVIATAVKVTIPEGFDIDEIAQLLEENKVCTADQFKEAVNNVDSSKYNVSFIEEPKSQAEGVHYSLEGFLFPDTYEFYATNDKSGAEQAIKKMLQNMDKKFTPEMRARAKEMGYSMNDILTLASIIEMESSVAEYADKQKVSAVFHNRLKSDSYPNLQSDPTSQYPYNTDLYDTYKAVGLAPGAYCSPGLDSIKAALYPDEKCTAYYFVTDKDMKFYFNNTLTEHNNTILKLKRAGLWV